MGGTSAGRRRHADVPLRGPLGAAVSRRRAGHLVLGLSLGSLAPLAAQQVQRFPLRPPPPRGEPVAPFFEGWYRNADGTFTFSFGYFNLDTEQVLEIPIGPDNFIEPAEFNGRHPTHFPVEPRRDRGVFQVTVPASYADEEQRVVWTVTLAEPKTVAVGRPLTLTAWTSEVSERRPEDVVNTDVAVRLTWFKHQEPAAPVVFDPEDITLEEVEGEATTTATFSQAGDYVLRVRVDNWGANDSSGGDQCCWTNGYVRVTVTPGGGTP